MKTNKNAIDQICINTIRFLAVDAVQKAKSGHPGMPLGAAPIIYTLWDRFLKHNPHNPTWLNRDRFVLSAGHASAMLYAMLHLTGYRLTLDDIKNFRQLGSKAPGHPERDPKTGIEVTTGPLGQGFANAVGMALAERWLAANFNRLSHEVIDHNTYVLASDGDLMEGVASEAASFAGTQQLGKLIAIYDANGISIEGDTDLTFTEDVARRFRSYHWHVQGPIDGNDLTLLEAAIQRARMEKSRPSLIICNTIIGYGSPIEGTARTHGEPLGEENVKTTKKKMDWPLKPLFHIPEKVARHMKQTVKRGRNLERNWREIYDSYERTYPALARQLERQLKGDLPYHWDKGIEGLFTGETEPSPTRNASGRILSLLVQNECELVGGSADLGPSNKTVIVDKPDLSAEKPGGSNIHYGVREHAMGAIANGLALHGGIRPYTGTFLVFSDYMRPPMRMAALMGLPVIFVFSHDSIGVGEDGPTHQPVEQIMGLREVPGLTVIRPADNAEVAETWKYAMQNKTPTVIILTRQKVPQIDRNDCSPAAQLTKGAYILWESDDHPDIIIIATGSEVHLALGAGQRLAKEGAAVRVISMPSWEIFDQQPQKYRNQVLPPKMRCRIAIEAGHKQGWEKYVGLDGAVIGMTSFGASAPGSALYAKFDITTECLIAKAKELLSKK